MPKVSFIVPVYNCETTLNRTLDSLKKQKLDDFEVIMVDDGSSDGSREKAQEWVQKDERFRLIYRDENKGVSYTRNEGIDAAKGEYFRFIDADDYVPVRSTKEMVEIADENDSDLVIGIMRRKSILESYNYADTVKLTKKEWIDKNDPLLVNSFSLCNKLFRGELIRQHGIRLKPLAHAEDGLFLFEFLNHAEKICGYPDVSYTYFKPEFFEGKSSTQNLDIHMLEDVLSAVEQIPQVLDAPTEELLESLYFRMLNTTLIGEYYRKIWRMDDATCDLLFKKVEFYKSKLDQARWYEICSRQTDISQSGGLLGKTQIVEQPLLTIAISKDVSLQHLPELLYSLYYQRSPFFSVVIEEQLKDSVPEFFLNKENLSFYSGTDFFNDVIYSGESRYLLFIEDDLIYTFDAFSKSYNRLLRDIDFVSGNCSKAGNERLEFLDPLQFGFASYSNGDRDGLMINDRFDGLLSNKIFKRSSLHRECFRFTQDRAADIERMYRVFSHGKYRNIRYILAMEDDEILSRTMLPGSVPELLDEITVRYDASLKRDSDKVMFLSKQRKQTQPKDCVLFVPAKGKLRKETKKIYDALRCSKDIAPEKTIKDIFERMCYYNKYRIIAFEGMDFQLDLSCISPGQVYVPLIGELSKKAGGVEDIARFLEKELRMGKRAFFKERKMLKQWVSTEKENQVIVNANESFAAAYDQYRPMPIQNGTVLFLSDINSTLNGNFKAVYDHLPDGLIPRLFLKGSKQEPYTNEELDRLANWMCTSEYIILEDFFSFMDLWEKKEGQEICQLWHAAGAYKKFAFSRVNGPEALSIHQSYRKYTKAIVSSEAIRDNYAEAFGISKDCVQATGIPRTDVLSDNDFIRQAREIIESQYPIVKGKKLILFAPTYRGRTLKDADYAFDKINPDQLYDALHEEYVFAFRWHPALTKNLRRRDSDVYHMSKRTDFFLDFSDYEETDEVLAATDLLITDYSSIIFDFSILNRPVVLYPYDMEEYSEGGRGWYYPYECYVYGRSASTFEELLDAIRQGHFDQDKRNHFYETFMDACDGNATEKTVKFLLGKS